MKNTVLIIITLLAGFTTVWSQKIKDEQVKFDYKRLPLEPIDKSITNYTSEVILSYEAKASAKQEEAKAKAEEDEAKFQKDQADAEEQYQQDLKDAEAEYQKALEEWNKKSTAQKIIDKKVMEDGKPKKRSVYRRSVTRIVQPKDNGKTLYDKEMLSSQFLKLAGFQNEEPNAVKIIVTLFGFEQKHNVVDMPSTVTKDGRTYTTHKYRLDVEYKFPTLVKVQLPNGKFIMNETIEHLNDYKMMTGKTFDSRSAVYEGMDEDKYFEEYEKKILDQSMKEINEYINSRFGYSTVKREITLNNVESKKMDYSDFQTAYTATTEGLPLLKDKKKDAVAKLKTAIEIWNKALAESNPDDKKSRIDNDVTYATAMNLIEIGAVTDDFASAEAAAEKAKNLKMSKKEKAALDKSVEFLKEQKVRWEANNK
jgi:hypothetical protein